MRSRYAWQCSVLLVSALLWMGWNEIAEADPLSQVVRVEEDWELVAGTPDPDSVAPQVICAISPVGNVESVHATFEVNHQSLPEFVAGGLQLQIWNDGLPEVSRKYPNGCVMHHSGETVRWTQSMELEEGGLTFEVIAGSSTTWGSFGGQGYLKATFNTTLTSLNGYNPAVSVDNSGIGYAANRVQSLVLRKVRLITSTGEVLEDDTVRSVYPRQ